MAEVIPRPSFGAELKDGFKPVNAWVSIGISWLDEVQQFYRERSAIEKEYAGKLSGLAKKYFEKKARKSSALSVGENPSVTPGSLECASMTTWGVQLTTLESRAAEHDRFSAQLISNLAEPLKQLSTRYEEIRKSHAEFSTRLEKERDASYAELRRAKGKYDGVCQEVENRRKKVDGSVDFGKQKAQNAYQQQILEMHNAKNSYLIGINVTNKQKERYFHEYVPELVDSMQDLNESRVAKLSSIWSLGAEIEASTLSRSVQYLEHLRSEIQRNNPFMDSMMFLQHNITRWAEPANAVFEPSPVWHDDDGMATDEMSKNYLRNILTKSKAQLSELKREVDKQRREVEGAKRVRQNVREGRDKNDEVELVRTIFHLQEGLHELERKKVSAEVEISTITTAVGDVSIGGRNHNFKSQTFKIPTNCDFCGDRIWGLSAKGFDCKDCGYTCHSKCEMKIPADCPGEVGKDERKKLKAERQEAAHAAMSMNGTSSEVSAAPIALSRSDTANSLSTLSSGYAKSAQRSVSSSTMLPTEESSVEDDSAAKAPVSKPIPARRNRIVAPPPAQYVSEKSTNGEGGDHLKPGEQKGRMLYPYRQTGDGEISVSEGKDVVIIEPDDGSGWMKVRAGHDEGLVPASYVEALPNTPSASDRPASTYSASSTSLAGSISQGGKKKGPAVAPKRGAKKLKYVEALYDYEARSDAEHSMSGGERFVLINKDAGDGWADVEKGGQVKCVPANYVQEVP